MFHRNVISGCRRNEQAKAASASIFKLKLLVPMGGVYVTNSVTNVIHVSEKYELVKYLPTRYGMEYNYPGGRMHVYVAML